MADKRLESYSEDLLDVLNEISNIGTGNAVTALSQMMDTDIEIEVPVTCTVDFETMANLMGGKERTVVAVLINLKEGIDGMMMLIMDRQSANLIINGVQKRSLDHEIEEYSEMDISALTEVGNIMAGSYLNAISKFSGITIRPGVPQCAIDMAGAIMEIPVMLYGEQCDNALLIHSKAKSPHWATEGYFLLIPTLDSVEKLYNALG